MKAKNNKSFAGHVTRTGWDKSWQDHVRGTKWMVGGHLEKDNLSSMVNDVMTIGLVSRSAKFRKFPTTSSSIFSCRVATTANVFLTKTKEVFKFSDKDSRQLQWRVQLPSAWSAPWKVAQTMLCCETQAALSFRSGISNILSERISGGCQSYVWTRVRIPIELRVCVRCKQSIDQPVKPPRSSL